MTSPARRSGKQLSTIAASSPVVITERLTRMALQSQPASARDLNEWNRMISEKGVAAMEGWLAMSAAWWSLPFSAAAWSFWSPMSSSQQRWSALNRMGDRLLAEGLKPVARTVAANRSRLARTHRSR